MRTAVGRVSPHLFAADGVERQDDHARNPPAVTLLALDHAPQQQHLRDERFAGSGGHRVDQVAPRQHPGRDQATSLSNISVRNHHSVRHHAARFAAYLPLVQRAAVDRGRQVLGSELGRQVGAELLLLPEGQCGPVLGRPWGAATLRRRRRGVRRLLHASLLRAVAGLHSAAIAPAIVQISAGAFGWVMPRLLCGTLVLWRVIGWLVRLGGGGSCLC